MKQFFIWLAIVAAVVGLMFIAKPAKTAPITEEQSGTSELVSSEKLHDFGTIRMANGKVEYVFKVTNPTARDIKVPSLYTSCMCTTAFYESGAGFKGPFGMQGMGYLPPLDEVIPAGGSRMIKIVFDPNAHGPAGVGYMERYAFLVDENGKVLPLEVKAMVTP